MKTFHFISSLNTTIVVTDKKEFQGSQTTVKKTAFHKINLIDRIEKVEDNLLRVASIERKKENKKAFFNKHKK